MITTLYSSVGRAGDCNVRLGIPRSLVRIQLERFQDKIHDSRVMHMMVVIVVEWPSGLWRQFKALVSSEARVQIPSQPYFARIHSILIPSSSSSSMPHIRDGVVGNISACHADARGSIPRRGESREMVQN